MALGFVHSFKDVLGSTKEIITVPLLLGVVLNFLIAAILAYYTFFGGAGLPRFGFKTVPQLCKFL